MYNPLLETGTYGSVSFLTLNAKSVMIELPYGPNSSQTVVSKVVSNDDLKDDLNVSAILATIPPLNER